MDTTPGAEPVDLIPWLLREVEKATRDADKFRAAALDALCKDADNASALFDAQTRAEGMALAFRLAADKARFVQRRALERDLPVVPETVLGATTIGELRGVLFRRGGSMVFRAVNGAEFNPCGLLAEVDPLDDRPEVWRPLLREHDANRDAREGGA